MTAHTGLADTLMLAVSINVKKYPKASRFSGVHVSLHPPVRRPLSFHGVMAQCE